MAATDITLPVLAAIFNNCVSITLIQLPRRAVRTGHIEPHGREEPNSKEGIVSVKSESATVGVSEMLRLTEKKLDCCDCDGGELASTSMVFSLDAIAKPSVLNRPRQARTECSPALAFLFRPEGNADPGSLNSPRGGSSAGTDKY